MANENENQGGKQDEQSEFDRDRQDEQSQSGQGSTGQQGQQSEFGKQGGQAQTGQQGQTSTAERTDEQDTTGGVAQGGGFVGTQGEETGEYLQEGEIEQAGFAEQGRGAAEEDSDIALGDERSLNRDTDIEGSSDDR